MYRHQGKIRIIRHILGMILVVVALTTTWAWGQVAQLAEAAPRAAERPATALYAAWQQEGQELASLFRSMNEGASWQPLALLGNSTPVTWADDAGRHVAVAMDDGTLLRSGDRGENWTVAAQGFGIVSLLWDDDGSLTFGTDGQGLHRLASDGSLIDLSATQEVLASARIVGLAQSEGRLYAATPTALFYTDDAGTTAGSATWTKSLSVPDWITAIAATGRETVYIGSATSGVHRSTDAGQTWQPAYAGLGLAAGQMVRITALRTDPQEPDVLYVAVDHVVGSTQVHASAAGTFVTVDGGASWQPLTGPTFPEADHASGLVVVPGKPLYVQAVTASGLRGYAPDTMKILAALESADPRARAAAARQLGLARPLGVWSELLAALDDPEPAVSVAAAEALGRINNPAAASGLLVAIEHPHEQVRLGAARALGMMGVEAAVDPLRSMLLNGTGLQVSVAGEALGRIGGQAATEALLVALADAQPTARWHVAMVALETMGEPAVGPLVAMLDSQDAYARRNAARALGWIGSQSATKALGRALQEDPNATVRAQAAWALGEIGDPAAGKVLARAQRRDPATTVQTEVAWALARVPQQAAAHWPASWAPVLNRFQAARWLVLALSLAVAAWLMVGTSLPAWNPIRLRNRVR
jgi:HEAT repeat protein